jgi:hypothetical protein
MHVSVARILLAQREETILVFPMSTNHDGSRYRGVTAAGPLQR